MATTISGSAGAMFSVTCTKDEDLTLAKKPITIAGTSWTYGAAANQVNVVYAETRTLADGANETLDLYASGSLLDLFGTALTMTAIKLVYLKNNSDDATLKVLGTDSTALDICADSSDIILVPPGGTLLWTDPSATGTVITTNKNLKIEHDGTGSSTMDVDVIVLGLD